MSWLSGWTYRRAITITEQSGSTLTDYQVRIELNSSNFDFSKANANGSDIRFTADDGETLLPYWIEKWDDVNEEAVIWVKVPSIPANGSITIYMYYGNSEAVSESDGRTVFERFMDVNYINEWIANGHTIEANDGSIYIHGEVGEGDAVWDFEDYSTSEQFIVEINSKSLYERVNFRIRDPSDALVSVVWRAYYDNTDAIYCRSAGSDIKLYEPFSDTEYYIIKEIIDPTAKKITYEVYDEAGTLLASLGPVDYTVTSASSTLAQLEVSDGSKSVYQIDVWIRYFRIRKYAEQEPTASIGSEEIPMKHWDGSQWKSIKAIYYWDGSQWVEALGVYYWNGSQWIRIF